MLKTIKNIMIIMLCFVFCLCSQNEEDIFAEIQQNERTSHVVLGGDLIGIEYTPKGLPIVSVSDEISTGLCVGDVLYAINDNVIYSSKQVSSILNGEDCGKELCVTYFRKGKEQSLFLKPTYDLISKKYVLGVWVKNEISGVGTLTYINPNTGYFGSLGHPITVFGESEKIGVHSGKIYSCNIVGIAKGAKGVPGELRGVISKQDVLGSVQKNNEYGVFGTIENSKMLKNCSRLIEVGGRKTIKPGNAKIYCSLKKGEVRGYDIQIIKTNYQNVSNEKSLVFKVVDKDLIKQTGGIVQGMSGSPIVQNGKLVGAVTHVFTNDSTKGFGIYIDWMM